MRGYDYELERVSSESCSACRSFTKTTYALCLLYLLAYLTADYRGVSTARCGNESARPD